MWNHWDLNRYTQAHRGQKWIDDLRPLLWDDEGGLTSVRGKLFRQIPKGVRSWYDIGME